MSSEFNTSENSPSDTSAIVEVNQTDALIESELAGESDEIKRETKALIDAIRQRAQTEAQTAGEFTRETYLRLIRQARESIEHNKLFDPDQIERSAETLKLEAEKNWNALVQEVTEISDRLSEAAKAAWEKLTAPK
ncbi:hypothetical protein [Thermocoleostomius sinensis]|jgi:hypothetical protein|uniref:Uncharacterized protein n=1 Tax=Thermocoleostomius sinensis A174 TaxID=2016057 RepID=A0A9E8ZIV0_9CYAN|nr:hypothetical protein [Thermocoleostomius sinensis]WAL62093.1 hypothetical protein OXH18_08935 [Thermocoleostomius sinensis A174]